MLEMPIRRRTMIQQASVMFRGREVMKQSAQQRNNLHRQRLTCADSVRNVTQTQDWTNGMRISPSGRFQVIEEPKPKLRILSREGIRWDAAWIALILAAVLCIGILVAEVAGIGIGSRSVNKLDAKIANYMEKNGALMAELETLTKDYIVCTEAVKLNMISGRAAQTVRLTAPTGLKSAAATEEILTRTAGRLTGTAGD